ncbi:MAG TPA: beta-ketoacyl-[acyl-carrier-protein] synthase family protein [Pirellulaceae bacterium]|nr:beta-ketoacyl-[acyl-carrier-protein] synthase family protein [Pirellulaceae bacterium]
MEREAIWITGSSGICSLGDTPREIADKMFAGRSGVGPVTRFAAGEHPSQIAACVDRIPAPREWDAADFERRQPWEQLLLWCSHEALQDADCWRDRGGLRLGIVLGMGAEWMVNWEQDANRGGVGMFDPRQNTVGLARRLETWLGVTGPSVTVGAACASANIAFGVARQWLQAGWVDVCLAGGCEYSVTPMGLAGFGNLGALSKRNDAPTAASRPFDRGRDGFVIAEGCALLILERESHARARDARPLAELAGFGATSDAHHLVIPSTDSGPAARAMQAALDDARVNPEELDYVNAHATSTPVGDTFESRGLQAVLGPAVGRVPVSSTKSMTGHMLSAASAVEALACLAAIDRQAVPPTINLDDLDPECAALCHVPHQAREHRVRVAMSNAFGFGGSNTSVVFRKVA